MKFSKFKLLTLFFLPLAGFQFSFLASAQALSFCADRLLQKEEARTFEIAPRLSVYVRPNQILGLGKAQIIGSQEYGPYYGINDDSGAHKVFENPDLSQMPFYVGDVVFFIRGSAVERQGFFGENNGHPVLYKNAKLTQLELGAKNFRRFFQDWIKDGRVAVIHTPQGAEGAAWKKYVTPSILAYLEHQKNPSRFVNINGHENYELGHWQKALFGEPLYGFDFSEADQSGASVYVFAARDLAALKLPSTNPVLKYGEADRLRSGDFVFLFDSQGQEIARTEVGFKNNLEIPPGRKFEEIKSLIVIRKK